MNFEHFSVMSAFNFMLGDGDICTKKQKLPIFYVMENLVFVTRYENHSDFHETQ